jgi:hypothetical protein
VGHYRQLPEHRASSADRRQTSSSPTQCRRTSRDSDRRGSFEYRGRLAAFAVRAEETPTLKERSPAGRELRMGDVGLELHETLIDSSAFRRRRTIDEARL